MIGRKRKPRGYRVDGLDSLEGQNELAKQDLTRADLEQAITVYERVEKTRNPHRHQRGGRVRIESRGLEPGSARRLGGASDRDPLGADPGAALRVAPGDRRQAAFPNVALDHGTVGAHRAWLA